MNINKQELLKSLQADLKSAEVLKNDLDAKISDWRNAYEGKPYGNEEEGKSKIVSRDIKKQSEWQHASVVDPFVSTSEIVKCTPITYEDKDLTEECLDIIANDSKSKGRTSTVSVKKAPAKKTTTAKKTTAKKTTAKKPTSKKSADK
mgnify:CR=1 FL=1